MYPLQKNRDLQSGLCVLGFRVGNRSPPNDTNPNCLDLVDGPMVLPNFTYKFDANNTPDAFKHIPGTAK